jgi:hypothetical protein
MIRATKEKGTASRLAFTNWRFSSEACPATIGRCRPNGPSEWLYIRQQGTLALQFTLNQHNDDVDTIPAAIYEMDPTARVPHPHPNVRFEAAALGGRRSGRVGDAASAAGWCKKVFKKCLQMKLQMRPCAEEVEPKGERD